MTTACGWVSWAEHSTRFTTPTCRRRRRSPGSSRSTIFCWSRSAIRASRHAPAPPMLTGGAGACLEARIADRDQQNMVEREDPGDRRRLRQVGVVNRVECSAQDTQPHAVVIDPQIVERDQLAEQGVMFLAGTDTA